jgi:cytochrome c biogenesis protein CcmG, thiol:disulfide interchange protein DsbE
MSKRRDLPIALLGVLAGAAVFMYLRGRPAGPPGIGDHAPAFAGLPGLPSGTISLADYRHRVLVLHFWATWCPPCIEEAPSFERFAEKVKPLGVAVLGVSEDTDRKALERFVAEQHLTFPIALDPSPMQLFPERTVPTRYGTFQLPETYILDRDGRVAEKIVGPDDWGDPRMLGFVEALARPAEGQGQ